MTPRAQAMYTRLKLLALRAMESGLTVLPHMVEGVFAEEDVLRFKGARFIGEIALREVLRQPQAALAVREQDWPSEDVTCLVWDDRDPILVWLHRPTHAGHKMRVVYFGRFGGRVQAWEPMTLSVDGQFVPSKELRGEYPPPSARMVFDGHRLARSAMEGATMLMLRYTAARRNG